MTLQNLWETAKTLGAVVVAKLALSSGTAQAGLQVLQRIEDEMRRDSPGQQAAIELHERMLAGVPRSKAPAEADDKKPPSPRS